MSLIINQIGSLTYIKNRLNEEKISDFNSVGELIAFNKTYNNTVGRLINKHVLLVEREKQQLEVEIKQLKETVNAQKTRIEKALNSEIESLQQRLPDREKTAGLMLLIRINSKIYSWIIKGLIFIKKRSYNRSVTQHIQPLLASLALKRKRNEFIQAQFDDAVQENARIPLQALEQKRLLIEELMPSIYGAIGEQKVVRQLQNLSDDYTVINDFNLSFQKPIFWNQENEYIKSIQVDHLVVSKAGIFIIETKNWSSESIENSSFRSPVQQIRRSGFALARICSEAISNQRLGLRQHHWGEKKIPIRNVIVLINNCPAEEFQYVKILSLTELNNYITYFKPVFTRKEVDSINQFLAYIMDYAK